MNSMIILASLLIIYLKNNLLLGDLNINVLDHDVHPPTNELFSHFPNITFFNIYIRGHKIKQQLQNINRQ